jgi:hypothetical protein
MLALHHRLFQLFLVIGKQSTNLAMRFVAGRVNEQAPAAFLSDQPPRLEFVSVG